MAEYIKREAAIECNYYQCTADVEPVREWVSVKD